MMGQDLSNVFALLKSRIIHSTCNAIEYSKRLEILYFPMMLLRLVIYKLFTSVIYQATSQIAPEKRGQMGAT